MWLEDIGKFDVKFNWWSNNKSIIKLVWFKYFEGICVEREGDKS